MGRAPIVCIFGFSPTDENVQKLAGISNDDDGFDIYTFDDDSQISYIIYNLKPHIIVTVGNRNFPHLQALPVAWRTRWLHFNDVVSISKDQIYYCFLANVANIEPDPNNPLISIFTTTYRSGDKINRPFDSLRKQSYDNWEWVIYDDSEDHDVTWVRLEEMLKKDPRIRLYRGNRNNGSIGDVKNIAASLCRGEFICELDHDDELTSWCLEEIVKGFKSDPTIGFVYTDFCELFEGSETNYQYGDMYGFGYGAYRNELWRGRWRSTATSLNLHSRTLRDIVGVPNHMRCWRTSVYRQLRGNSPLLHVADDYDLLVKTFLHSKMYRIPKLCYLQYRNADGNFTFIRNGEIRKLQYKLSGHYWNQVSERCEELGLENEIATQRDIPIAIPDGGRIWEAPFDYIERHVTHYPPVDPTFINVIVATYDNPTGLRRTMTSLLTQTHTNWEAYVVGNKCPKLVEEMDSPFYRTRDDQKIKWWNMLNQRQDNTIMAYNYALRVLVTGGWVLMIDNVDDNGLLVDDLERLLRLTQRGDTQRGDTPPRVVTHNNLTMFNFNLLAQHGYLKWDQPVSEFYSRISSSPSDA